jgi:hypothetical protein
MTWFYTKEYIMGNKPITINTTSTIGETTVFKLVIEMPYAPDGLDCKFEEQPTHTSGKTKKYSEKISYNSLQHEGYRKSPAVFGISMWTRRFSPSIFTDYGGAWLAGGLPTPHPISLHWVWKSVGPKPQPIHSAKAATEDNLTNLGYKPADVSKTNAPGETVIWLKDGRPSVFVDNARAFLSKYQGCWRPVSVDWLLVLSV